MPRPGRRQTGTFYLNIFRSLKIVCAADEEFAVSPRARRTAKSLEAVILCVAKNLRGDA